jgi:hypothetical protein
MKKHLLFLVAIPCVAMINTSCSTKEVPPVTPDDSSIIYEEPENSAVRFEIEENDIEALEGDGSLTAINITEYGKAVIEVTTDDGVTFATYDVEFSTSEYTVTDGNGKEAGKIQYSHTRATEYGYLMVRLTVTSKGKTYTFITTEPVRVKKITPDDTSTRTRNIARTWKVPSMNLVLEGDVNVSKLERSGNLQVFADEAQYAGADLSEGDYRALCKSIKSITLDRNGLFAIEYDNNTTDVCLWEWADGEKNVFSLTKIEHTEFGNKFIPDGSEITVNFTTTSTAFTLQTNISDSKDYTATLTFVLVEDK